jgi:hypothetical protein
MFPSPRRRARLLGVAGVAFLVSPLSAHAGKNDLNLLNLCPLPATGPQVCGWIARDAVGGTAGVRPDAEGQSNFRSLMSELGVAIAPRLMTPADTLGYAGFQFSAELGVTKINNDRPYWRGVDAVNPLNPSAGHADNYLTTVGGYVRKGMWFPLPAFEFGAGALSVLGSRMYVLQGYAKIALQEGFHGWALPSFAVRGSASQLLGTSQVDMTVFGVDVLASKAFSIGGTARIEPYLGWSMLFIRARSAVIDATPTCDATVVQAASPSTTLGADCNPADRGTWKDLNANFTFPNQDVIMRQRWFGGFKLKLSVLFLAAQVEYVPAGSSSDDEQPERATDRSGAQETYSLSGGFDF